ncbi:MAG: hypothetical protein HYY19_00700, partial [Candidatus Rokubacteria bacterium]|nr:hypothetical protein [Candidatus Rokubacteria bacterium]
VTPILEAWEASNAKAVHPYPAGSRGPEAAEELIGQDARQWVRL